MRAGTTLIGEGDHSIPFCDDCSNFIHPQPIYIGCIQQELLMCLYAPFLESRSFTNALSHPRLSNITQQRRRKDPACIVIRRDDLRANFCQAAIIPGETPDPPCGILLCVEGARCCADCPPPQTFKFLCRFLKNCSAVLLLELDAYDQHNQQGIESNA